MKELSKLLELLQPYRGVINPHEDLKGAISYSQKRTSPEKQWLFVTRHVDEYDPDSQYGATVGNLFCRILQTAQKMIEENIFDINILFSPSYEGGYRLELAGSIEETDEERKNRLINEKKSIEYTLNCRENVLKEIEELKQQLAAITKNIEALDQPK